MIMLYFSLVIAKTWEKRRVISSKTEIARDYERSQFVATIRGYNNKH